MLRPFALLVAFALPACSLLDSEPGSSPPPIDGAVLASGTSSGECLGYCFADLTVSPDGEAVLVENGADFVEGEYVALPERRRSRALGVNGYAALQETLNPMAFAAADTVYGCPDCDDSGAEYVGLAAGKRVTFESGRPPEPLAAFASAMREVRGGFAD